MLFIRNEKREKLYNKNLYDSIINVDVRKIWKNNVDRWRIIQIE